MSINIPIKNIDTASSAKPISIPSIRSNKEKSVNETPDSSIPTSGITLYSHKSAPNGFKVAIVLTELKIPFRTIFLDFSKNEQKSPAYLSINPNARVPTIIDHDNDDFSVWESGSIIIYLCEKMGPNCPIWSTDPKEKSQIISWIFFQASGHSSMFGQALHFLYFHSERVPSAVERYTSEVRRLYSVLEMALLDRREQLLMEVEAKSEDSDLVKARQAASLEPVWLVGNRITVADLSFVTWSKITHKIGINIAREFPEVAKWLKTMYERPTVQKALNG